jgi:hypothetical protein
LVVLPRPETSHVKGLDQVGLMRRELDNLDMVHLGLKDKIGSFVAHSSIY